VAGLPTAEIETRVRNTAKLLKLEPYLERRPLNLSGGQQQRTAIARALVKQANLVLLDEPLANLDYKLREELRDELPKLFSGRNAIVFYATTEPHEALLFGNKTLTMHEGRITQFGPTAEIYRKPNSLISAQVFSDPPINIARVTKKGGKLQLSHGNVSWPVAAGAAKLPDGDYSIGLQPHYVLPQKSSETSGALSGRVLVTEISGSESVVHIDVGGQTWVSQSHGVHPHQVGETATFHADVSRALFFDAAGKLVT
jgi:glycerol transport system ATP-binding protein